MEFTPEELALWETHPLRGIEILTGLPAIPTDVLQIIFQHHENCLGMGYPKGLKKNSIHPLARIVHVADHFCNYALGGPSGGRMHAQDAIDIIGELHAGTFDNDVYQALHRLILRS